MNSEHSRLDYVLEHGHDAERHTLDYHRGRALRSDGLRNREAVVTAAISVFLRDGLDAPLDVVAAAAGVGVGTLYRNFANRDELYRSIYARAMFEVSDVIDEALRLPDSYDAIMAFAGGTTQILVRFPALPRILVRMAEFDPGFRPGDALVSALSELTRRGIEAGILDPGIEVTDLAMLPVMLAGTTPPSNDTARRDSPIQPWRRYLAFALAGMRPGAVPVTSRPLEREEYFRLMHGLPLHGSLPDADRLA